jgi:hypothetical protein
MIYNQLLALGFLSAAQARVQWSDLHSYSFDKFVSDFKQSWSKDSSEFVKRKAIFEEELHRVQMHNARNATWKEVLLISFIYF